MLPSPSLSSVSVRLSWLKDSTDSVLLLPTTGCAGSRVEATSELEVPFGDANLQPGDPKSLLARAKRHVGACRAGARRGGRCIAVYTERVPVLFSVYDGMGNVCQSRCTKYLIARASPNLPWVMGFE